MSLQRSVGPGLSILVKQDEITFPTPAGKLEFVSLIFLLSFW
jgi:hypothetical protein